MLGYSLYIDQSLIPKDTQYETALTPFDINFDNKNEYTLTIKPDYLLTQYCYYLIIKI